VPLPAHLDSKVAWAQQFFTEEICKGPNGCPAKKQGSGPHPRDITCKLVNDKNEPCGKKIHFTDKWRSPIDAFEHLWSHPKKDNDKDVENYNRGPSEAQQNPLPTSPTVTVSPLVRCRRPGKHVGRRRVGEGRAPQLDIR